MKRWVWLFLVCLLFCGCRREPSMGEQIIVTGIGIDERDGEWLLSIQAVDALKTTGSLSEQNETATAVYTASGDSVAKALQNFLNEAGKRTYILQNKILAVRDTLCRRQSMETILDYFIRNQEGRALVDVVVCRGDPSALLGITTGSDAIPAQYVSGLIDEGNRFGLAVETRLLDVQRASSGMYDLLAPILTVSEETPHLIGTAVFRGGMLCDELTTAETVGLQTAGGYTGRCLYTVEDVTFRLEGLRAETDVAKMNEAWRYHFTVKGTADVVEDGRGSALNESEKRRLITRVQTALAADAETALTRTMREYDADPLGLARLTAARYRYDGVTQQTARTALQNSTPTVTVLLSLRDK